MFNKKENVSNLARNLFSFHHGLSLQAVLQVSLFLLFGWIEQRAHWVPRTTPLPAPCIVTQIQLWLLVYQTSVQAKSSNIKHPYSLVQNFTTSPCGTSVAISRLCEDHIKRCFKKLNKITGRSSLSQQPSNFDILVIIIAQIEETLIWIIACLDWSLKSGAKLRGSYCSGNVSYSFYHRLIDFHLIRNTKLSLTRLLSTSPDDSQTSVLPSELCWID